MGAMRCNHSVFKRLDNRAVHLGRGFVRIFYSPWRGIPSGLVSDKAFRPELLMKINCLDLMARRDGSVTDSDTPGCPPSARRSPQKRDLSHNAVSPDECECDAAQIFMFYQTVRGM
jgi:hypothetical protein